MDACGAVVEPYGATTIVRTPPLDNQVLEYQALADVTTTPIVIERPLSSRDLDGDGRTSIRFSFSGDDNILATGAIEFRELNVRFVIRSGCDQDRVAVIRGNDRGFNGRVVAGDIEDLRLAGHGSSN